MMDTTPRRTWLDLHPLLLQVAAQHQPGAPTRRKILIEVDPRLEDVRVFADTSHLRLVFRNLIHNALRATEGQALDRRFARKQGPFVERVLISLHRQTPSRVVLHFLDNGRGIPAAIAPKLYKERCSDRTGAGHGLGGIIIRKLLDLNQGSIDVVDTRRGLDNGGTLQQIELPTVR